MVVFQTADAVHSINAFFRAIFGSHSVFISLQSIFALKSKKYPVRVTGFSLKHIYLSNLMINIVFIS
jgi:hypothetical protein